MGWLTQPETETLFSAIAATLSAATLVFILRIAMIMRDAEKQRAAIVEERLASVRDDLERTEKWSAREKAELSEKNESLRNQLEDILRGSGITVQSLASGASLKEAQDSIQQSVNDLLRRMENIGRSIGGTDHPGWHLELAKGYMASGDWHSAARHFDKYAEFHPADYDMQFSRGVAHANARVDSLPALRAYNEAIAFAPATLEPDMRARFFTYRGAMLKRMNRLDEAASDLQLALSLAKRDHEVYDVKYNLAAVYAMQGKRSEMLAFAAGLRGRRRELAAIRYHLNDYFAVYSADPDLLAIIATADAG